LAPARSSRTSVRLGDAEIDLHAHSGQRGGTSFRLLPKEAELLAHLIRHRGRAQSREELLRAVWGYDATPTTRTVDTHVFQLRQKLEVDPAEPRLLRTVHGVGYLLQE
jgi:DNA-binding response OmpR family regulator